MKLSKRDEMWVVDQTLHCISMMRPMWFAIHDMIADEYGMPMSTYLALRHDMTGPWYVDYNSFPFASDKDIVTVFFPTNKDIEFVEKLMTFGRIIRG